MTQDVDFLVVVTILNVEMSKIELANNERTLSDI